MQFLQKCDCLEKLKWSLVLIANTAKDGKVESLWPAAEVTICLILHYYKWKKIIVYKLRWKIRKDSLKILWFYFILEMDPGAESTDFCQELNNLRTKIMYNSAKFL